MEISLSLEFYNRIMEAEDECEIISLNIELQAVIMTEQITDSRDIMILNMALQIKSNFFLIKEMTLFGANTTIIMGNMEDYDPEAMQLEEYQQEEFDDFKDGNVVMMKDFKKD